jgi:hypothetical protein
MRLTFDTINAGNSILAGSTSGSVNFDIAFDPQIRQIRIKNCHWHYVFRDQVTNILIANSANLILFTTVAGRLNPRITTGYTPSGGASANPAAYHSVISGQPFIFDFIASEILSIGANVNVANAALVNNTLFSIVMSLEMEYYYSGETIPGN